MWTVIALIVLGALAVWGFTVWAHTATAPPVAGPLDAAGRPLPKPSVWGGGFGADPTAPPTSGLQRRVLDAIGGGKYPLALLGRLDFLHVDPAEFAALQAKGVRMGAVGAESASLDTATGVVTGVNPLLDIYSKILLGKQISEAERAYAGTQYVDGPRWDPTANGYVGSFGVQAG